MIDVALWLEERGLGACVALFSANDVDFEVLEHLTDLDLKELGISFGYRKKLLRPHRARRGRFPGSDWGRSDDI
jgi:SAM domain (Sterile alpha motif)